jgi:methylphosphotriester-DNA--protein-cysteine methyltransferase
VNGCSGTGTARPCLLRVQHALVRLVEGEPVIDTAARLGWSNPTSFIEAFSALIGQTPGRYRAELRR